MIDKNIYEDYIIDFKENYLPKDEAYLLQFNKNRQLELTENHQIPIITKEKMNDNSFYLFIGNYKNKELLVSHTNKENNNQYSLDKLYEINPEIYQIAGRGIFIYDWYINHQYCGKCGTKNIIENNHMVLKCPKCNNKYHTTIAPAVIIAVTKDDKILMAKHSYNTKIKYALIAGFVEAGETVEETVLREVKEEVGINVKNIKYLKSQPWPFPNSLMLAFMAEYDSGEIKVDNDEIVKAKWFSVDEIEEVESDLSVFTDLIKEFKKKCN